MSTWVSVVQSIAVIGILVVALGLMVRAFQPANALKSTGAILGITVALILLPRLIIHTWDELPVWERAGLAILVLLVRALQSRWKPRKT